MLRLQAAQAAAQPQPTSQQGRDHDLPARRPVAHGHVRPQAGRPDGVPRRVQADRRPTSPASQICEHLPLQAKMWDKLAVVRSLVSVDEHSDSLVMTGYSENASTAPPTTRRSARSCRSSAAAAASDVPPFVSLRGMSRGTEPGFLGIAHRPFTPSGPGIANLRLANGVDRRPPRRPQGPARPASTTSAATSTPPAR